VALLADWFCEFRKETGVGRTPPVPDPQTVISNAKRGEVFIFWCVDGRPVAAAGHSAVRRGSSKIAPVYTPAEQRRRGFGAAVTVAAVESARRLGATEITLFTDAEYPASNAVYRGLGFEVIGEFAEFDVLDVVSR
jgi:predicted GNAT family acetyltransferase